MTSSHGCYLHAFFIYVVICVQSSNQAKLHTTGKKELTDEEKFYKYLPLHEQQIFLPLRANRTGVHASTERIRVLMFSEDTAVNTDSFAMEVLTGDNNIASFRAVGDLRRQQTVSNRSSSVINIPISDSVSQLLRDLFSCSSHVLPYFVDHWNAHRSTCYCGSRQAKHAGCTAKNCQPVSNRKVKNYCRKKNIVLHINLRENIAKNICALTDTDSKLITDTNGFEIVHRQCGDAAIMRDDWFLVDRHAVSASTCRSSFALELYNYLGIYRSTGSGFDLLTDDARRAIDDFTLPGGR